MQNIAKSLVKNDFRIEFTKGCFDIIAKKDSLLFLKILVNIDGLKEEHVLSLKTISYFLSAFPLIISLKNNREILKDEIVYSRFGLFVVTPETFKKVIREGVGACFSTKGKHIAKINARKLRERRKSLNLSLSKLSELTGISKKSLYEIEHGKVDPTIQSLKKLEKVLNVDLTLQFQLQSFKKIELEPREKFESLVSKEFSRIGIENSVVYSAPFNIIGKNKVTVITKLSKTSFELKKDAKKVKKISNLTSSKPVFVVKKKETKEINGIPVF